MKSEFLQTTVSRLTASIQQRFSQPRKLYLQGLTGNQALSLSGSRVLWIIGRGLLKHETFAVPAELSGPKRKSVLELQIRRWAPFQTPKWSVLWSGNRASVYAWDEAKINAAIAQEGLALTDCKCVPEPFMRTPGQSEVRLVKMSDGYEGQVWDSGFLAATRWWATLPRPTELSLLARAARVPHAQDRVNDPQPADCPLLAASWATKPDPLEDVWSAFEVPKFRAVAITAAAAVPVFLLGQWAVIAADSGRLSTQRTQLLRDSEAPRAQRQATLANLDVVDDLLALETFPPQVDVLARSAELLAKENVKIVDWTYDDGALEFSLRTETDADAPRFIELFEQNEMFEKVGGRPMPQDRTLRLTMNVTKRAGRNQ